MFRQYHTILYHAAEVEAHVDAVTAMRDRIVNEIEKTANKSARDGEAHARDHLNVILARKNSIAKEVWYGMVWYGMVWYGMVI